MTKPSYEELERYKEAAKHVDAIQARTIRELRAENLRLRGLLQRQWVSVQERLPDDYGTFETCSLDPKNMEYSINIVSWMTAEEGGWLREGITHWRELPEPPSGAESADIGKLDRVDEKADV